MVYLLDDIIPKNPIRLEGDYLNIHIRFNDYLNHTELSKSTKKHYIRISLIFLDYLNQKEITDVSHIDLSICNDYIRTFTGMSFKTIEQHICGLRYFLRYLNEENLLESDVEKLLFLICQLYQNRLRYHQYGLKMKLKIITGYW